MNKKQIVITAPIKCRLSETEIRAMSSAEQADIAHWLFGVAADKLAEFGFDPGIVADVAYEIGFELMKRDGSPPQVVRNPKWRGKRDAT